LRGRKILGKWAGEKQGKSGRIGEKGRLKRDELRANSQLGDVQSS